MNIPVLYRHFRLRKWLPLYMDGILDESQRKQVEDHLAKCPTCSNRLVELREMRSQIIKESARQVDIPEASLFQEKLRVASKLTMPQPSYSSRLMQGGWALACTLLLTASILFLGKKITSNTVERTIQSTSLFDLNGLIETFYEDEKREEFYMNQGALPVTPEQCCLAECTGCCDTRMLNALREHCSVLKNRLLKSADGKSIILECSFEGNMITIVRQDINAVSAVESRDTQQKVVTGVLCERFQKNDVQVTRWRSDLGKVTVLGKISDSELEVLIDASK